MAPAVSTTLAHLLGAGVAVAAAALVVARVDRVNPIERLRARLLAGVPWGTLLTLALVCGVYLFVQRGIDDPSQPVVIPFRAWSYASLEGLIWSSFAHASQSHLVGNVLSALVAGTIAEYAYGHVPPAGATPHRDRAVATDPVGRLRHAVWTNPLVRALCVVPAAMITFGLVSALFVLGPVIGFSGVVFALWGFAIVHYPIGTLASLTGVTLVRVGYETLRAPVEFAEATPSFGPPSWANIAVQGHALGFVAGALAAVWLIRRRSRIDASSVGDAERSWRQSTVVVFVAVFSFGASRRLWAAYWYLGNAQYELYRALGVGAVAVLAAIVAVAATGDDTPLPPTLTARAPAWLRSRLTGVTPAAIGIVLLVAAAGGLAGPGVAPNAVAVEDRALPGEAIAVSGYQVTYAEDVEDRVVSVIDIEAFGRTTAVNTSGVIVSNPERAIWTTAVSRGQLAFWGERTVTVGGTGWRETIHLRRTGWVAVGGEPTYRVTATHNATASTVFLSEPATAEPRIDGRTVTVAPTEAGFALRVTHDGATSVAALPAQNQSVTLHGVVLRHTGDRIYAVRGKTRVRVAAKERYEGHRDR